MGLIVSLHSGSRVTHRAAARRGAATCAQPTCAAAIRARLVRHSQEAWHPMPRLLPSRQAHNVGTDVEQALSNVQGLVCRALHPLGRPVKGEPAARQRTRAQRTRLALQHGMPQLGRHGGGAGAAAQSPWPPLTHRSSCAAGMPPAGPLPSRTRPTWPASPAACQAGCQTGQPQSCGSPEGHNWTWKPTW